MSRVLEYGFGVGGEEYSGVIDIHDDSIPLTERVIVFMMTGNPCCCDDFLCTEEELAAAIEELDSGDMSSSEVH